MTENLKLIRKIAWSFHSTSQMEWDDLFQEAALAYYESLPKYNPERGSITTFMWYVIGHHLQDYIKNEHHKWLGNVCPLEEACQLTVQETPLFETLSSDAQQLAKVIMNACRTFDSMPSETAHQRLQQLMIERGWTYRKTWQAIRDLKLALQ